MMGRHRNDGGVDRMVVQPPLAVSLARCGWAECAANRSLSRPGGIEIAALQLAEHALRRPARATKPGTSRSRSCSAEGGSIAGSADGRERLDLPHRPTEGDLDGKLVDQLDGHARA